MGQLSHSVERLGSPFVMMTKDVFTIPKGGVIRLKRTSFKFLFVLEGRIEHEIEGIRGRRPLQAGDILVAPVVKKHNYLNPSKTQLASVHIVRLFVDADSLQSRAQSRILRPESDFSDYILHHFSKVVQIPGGIDAGITELLHSYMSEAEHKRSGYRHRVRSICSDLIIATARKIADEPASPASPTPSASAHIIDSAKAYIHRQLATDLTLPEIAWRLGKSEEHLARVFKQQTGHSVFEYVREMRIHHAKTLLMDPTLNLTRIAELCGFQSLSFFSRSFRRQTSLSPTEYRKHSWLEHKPSSESP